MKTKNAVVSRAFIRLLPFMNGADYKRSCYFVTQYSRMHRSFFIRICEELKLHIREWEGRGTACVLVHGLAEGSFVWDDFANEIAPYSRVFAIDLRGHGASDWDSQKRYNFDTHVDDVSRVLDHLGLDSYIIVGHSLGGSIAAKIMALRPEEVLAAVVVDSGPVSDHSTDTILYNQIVEGYKNYSSIDEYVQWLSSRRFLANSELLEQFARRALICRRANEYSLKYDLAVANILLESHDQTWWWVALASSKVPVLFVRGMGSAVLPKRLSIQMAKATLKGELAIVEMAGHSVMTDNPSGFMEAVKPFLFAQLQFSNNTPL